MPGPSQRREEDPTTPRQSNRSWDRQALSAGGVMPLLLAEEPDLHGGSFSPPLAPTPSLSAINTPTFESRSLGNSPAAEGCNEQLSDMEQSGATAITNTLCSSDAGWLPQGLRPCSEDLKQETLLTDVDASLLAVLNSKGTLADHVRAELGDLRKQVHGLQGEIQSLRREQGALKGVLRFCSGGKIPVDFDGHRDTGRRPSEVLAQLVSSKPLAMTSSSADVSVSRPSESTPQVSCCGREDWPLTMQGGTFDKLATGTATKLHRGFRMKRASRDNAGSDCALMGAAVGADGLLDALWGSCMRAQRQLTLDSAMDVNDAMEDAMQGPSRSGSMTGLADTTNVSKVSTPGHNHNTFNPASNSERSSMRSSSTASASESRKDDETILQGLLPQDSQFGDTDMSDDAPLFDSSSGSVVDGFVSLLSRRGTMRVLQHCGLSLGQSVCWVASDEDVPQGQIGEVLGCSPAGVLVRFPGGTWYFSPSELVTVSQSSSTVGMECMGNDDGHEQAASNENSPPDAVVAAEAAPGVGVRCISGSSQAGVSSGWRRLDSHFAPIAEEPPKAEATTAEGVSDGSHTSGSSSNSENTRPPLQQKGGVLLLPFPELAQAVGGSPTAYQ